jgi:hypothetical protein
MNKEQTTLTQQELSTIKRTLFQMVVASGKREEPDYEALVEDLDGLSFRHYNINDYATQLMDVVNIMIDLDDLLFDMDMLYNYQKTLSK